MVIDLVLQMRVCPGCQSLRYLPHVVETVSGLSCKGSVQTQPTLTLKNQIKALS